jgi:hypothetical protein
MKKKLEEFTLAELVDRFAEIGIARIRLSSTTSIRGLTAFSIR